MKNDSLDCFYDLAADTIIRLGKKKKIQQIRTAWKQSEVPIIR